MALLSFFKNVFQRKENHGDHKEARSLTPYIGYFIFNASYSDNDRLEQVVLEALSEALETERGKMLVERGQFDMLDGSRVLRGMLSTGSIHSIHLPPEKCSEIPFTNRIVIIYLLAKREIERMHEELKSNETVRYIGALLFDIGGDLRKAIKKHLPLPFMDRAFLDLMKLKDVPHKRKRDKEEGIKRGGGALRETEKKPWLKYANEREIKLLYGEPDLKMAAALLSLVAERTHGDEVKVRLDRDENGEMATYLLDMNAIARMLQGSGLRITFCRNEENLFFPKDECVLEEAREIHVEYIFDRRNWYIVLAPTE